MSDIGLTNEYVGADKQLETHPNFKQNPNVGISASQTLKSVLEVLDYTLTKSKAPEKINARDELFVDYKFSFFLWISITYKSLR